MRGQQRVSTNRRRKNRIKRRTCKSKRMGRKRKINHFRQFGGVISPTSTFTYQQETPDRPLPVIKSYADFNLEKILMDRHEPGSKKEMAVATGYYTKDLSLKVAVKMCPSFHEENYKILEYEACVYKNVTELKWPNTVKYLFSGKISSRELETSSVFSPLFKLNYNNVYKPMSKREHDIFMLFTVMKPGVISLFDFLTKRQLKSSEQLKSIIFQVVITLCQLLKNNIQHNDFHASNILVDTTAVGEINYWIDADYSFMVPIAGCKILLFDWDLGFSKVCKNNPTYPSSLCPNYGVCPNFNSKFDLYTFMKGLKNYAEHLYIDHDFKNFYAFVMGDQPIFEIFLDRMCNAEPVPPTTLISLIELQHNEWYIWRNYDIDTDDTKNMFFHIFVSKNYRVYPDKRIIYFQTKEQNFELEEHEYELLQHLQFEKLQCVPYEKNEPASVKSPFDVLEHKYFLGFKLDVF